MFNYDQESVGFRRIALSITTNEAMPSIEVDIVLEFDPRRVRVKYDRADTATVAQSRRRCHGRTHPYAPSLLLQSIRLKDSVGARNIERHPCRRVLPFVFLNIEWFREIQLM